MTRANKDIPDRRALLGVGAVAAAALAGTAADAQTPPTRSLVLADRGAALRDKPDLAGVGQLLVLRYDDKSLACPAVYQRAGAEPAHPGKFKAWDGSWWELAELSVSLAAFGARGDRGDDTAAIESAFAYLTAKGGGELVVPPGFFAYTSDVRLLGNDIHIRGAGASSVLHGKNNARLILGNATPSNGRKTGTKLLHTRLSNLSIAPADNHAGECLLVDYADNTTFTDVNAGPWNQDGRTVTHGIKTNWAQYTQWRNVSINVNGYGIYIYLPKSGTENEDHFSIYSSWLYCGKVRNPNFNPACIAVERERGRHAAIFQFAVYSTHMGAFMAGPDDRFHTAGVLCINPDKGTRTFHAAQLTSCMFEYIARGIDLKSNATNETSRFALESCSFLQQDVCYTGTPYSASITSISNYYLQCKLLVDGPHILFEGCNVQTQMGSLSAQPLSYHRFAHKTGGVTSLSDIRLAQGGNQPVGAGQNALSVPCDLSAAPDRIRITPTWNTSFWVSQVSAKSFSVHFASPPTQPQNLYWDVEVGDN